MAYLTGPQVRRRYNVTDMTIWRWRHDERLGFPKPIVINRRNYFDEDEMEAFQKRLAAQTEMA